MSITVQDGKGRGNKAGVNSENRLLTTAETNLSGHFASLRDGTAFNITSVDSSAAAGDHIFYFQNNSTSKDFVIDLMRFSALNAGLWKVFVATGTAAGSNALTPTNMNLKSGVTAEATARGDGAITGVTAGALITAIRSPAATTALVAFDDILILGTNDAIVVEYDTGSTGAAEVFLRGYYLSPNGNV